MTNPCTLIMVCTPWTLSRTWVAVQPGGLSPVLYAPLSKESAYRTGVGVQGGTVRIQGLRAIGTVQGLEVVR